MMNRLLGTVAATLLFAGPALAQQSVYDTNPTPQERAQTNSLNTQALDAARTPPEATKADDVERAAYRAAHRWDAFYGRRDFRHVEYMRGRELMGVRVDAQAGLRVGRIRDIDTNAYGRVVRVSVSTGDGRAAWIDAADLRFDPETRVVVTDLSRGDVDAMSRIRF